MKQKDLTILAAVAFLSAVVALVLSNLVFASHSARSQQVETVDAITADFQTPSNKYFNATSVDPAQLVQIGPNDNQNPFTKTQQ